MTQRNRSNHLQHKQTKQWQTSCKMHTVFVPLELFIHYSITSRISFPEFELQSNTCQHEVTIHFKHMHCERQEEPFVECRSVCWLVWGRLFCTDGGHLNLLRSEGPVCVTNPGHFPLGYLAMGKNVFCQINDMFIQKEVAALFRSSTASKFERKNESERERETERVNTHILFISF